MVIEYNLNLDVNRNGQQGKINSRKGDNRSRVLIARLTSNGQKIDLSNSACKLYCKKPDGTNIYVSGEVEEDFIVVEFTQQMCTAIGIVECELQVIQDNRTLYSPMFIIEVEDTAFDESAVESTDEWTALEDMVGDIQDLQEGMFEAMQNIGRLDGEKVDKEEGKGLSSNDYDDGEKQKVSQAYSGVLTLSTSKVDKVEGKGLSSNDYTDTEKSTLASLNTAMPTVQNNIAFLQNGKVDKEEGKGLSSNDYSDEDKQALEDAIDDIATHETLIEGKVDKVTGKGLSTNDFTDEDKEKLDGLEPTDLSAYRTADEQDEIDETKVDKVTGKGLSTNDFTNADKSNLSGAMENITLLISQMSEKASNEYVNSRFTSVYTKTETDTLLNDKLEVDDLTDYVKNTDYATTNKGGVFKTNSSYGTTVENEYLKGIVKTFQQYNSGVGNMFISKTTLENVLTGKNINDVTEEEWTFTLADDTTVTKKVKVGS